MIELHLALEEPRPNDEKISVDQLTFYIDKFTARFLGDDTLTIDYDPAQGFLISNSDGIISKGITI